MNLFRSLHRLLRDNTVSHIELTAAPPFVKLIFDRSELESLLRSQSDVSNVLSQHFIRRRIFWEDFAAETPQYVLDSLRLAAMKLDDCVGAAQDANDAAVGLRKFARAWAAACVNTRNNLEGRLAEIDAEQAQVLGYDNAGEDTQEALRDALVTLRRTSFPLIAALIAILPDDDPTKKQAQDTWDGAMNQIRDAEIQRSVLPSFDEASENNSEGQN